MTTRRAFLRSTAAGFASLAAAPLASSQSPGHTRSPRSLPTNENRQSGRFRPQSRFGLGGVALGNGFYPASEEETLAAVTAAWDEGVRYFDTSPWYGLGLSERRFGVFLQDRPREEYAISTKVGRLLIPDASQAGKQVSIWHEVPPFDYRYDYTADGARRSVEDSLQRLGLAQIDIAYIHDLSPDNPDLGEDWVEHFETARKGAMPELSKMRDEGLIKAWGMGVNTIEPILRAFDAADPDIMLSACQYSLVKHEDAIERLFPRVEEEGASIVVGSPLMAGFLAGRQRYLYGDNIPEGMLDKRARFSRLAQEHGVDLSTAALQFCNAPSVVAAVIPGARNSRQVGQNADSMRTTVPAEFWSAAKAQGLLAENAPVPS